MDYEFKTLRELYDRINPALTAKKSEFKKIGMNYIKEADIWNYLTNHKWVNAKELSLSQMVCDIFDASCDDINNYVVNKATVEERTPELDN